MRQLPLLVTAQLELADRLVEERGAALRQIAFRRAVSGAYYAVFHALCSICADELVGWSRTGTLDPVYRSLNHGVVRKRLRGSRASAISPSLNRVAVIFAHLQDQRHDADYAPPKFLFSKRQVQLLISEARSAMALIEALSRKDERLRLAILLLANERAT